MPAYFRQLPEIQYPSRTNNSRISDYVTLKNLFKRATIREDIFANITFFQKYDILGDDRPDNVAYEIYGDESLDWLVLIANNIINVQTEWPMAQETFHNFLIEKYGSEEALQSVHHFETIQIKNSEGQTMCPGKLIVPENYSIKYFDTFLQEYVERTNVTRAITNYEYEDEIQTKKRSIYLLKPRYLNIILDDIESIMQYQKGSTQYVSETLKKTDNIRLYN